MRRMDTLNVDHGPQHHAHTRASAMASEHTLRVREAERGRGRGSGRVPLTVTWTHCRTGSTHCMTVRHLLSSPLTPL